MKKSARIGMRVEPVVKVQWETTAAAWGYPSLSAFITATMNWVIQYEEIGEEFWRDLVIAEYEASTDEAVAAREAAERSE